jgi:hypothetical protein
MDIHAWIEDDEDNLIDPYFFEYDLKKIINNCEGACCYKPLSPEKQKEIMDKSISLARSIYGNKVDERFFLYKFYKKPTYNNCFLNCLAYKKYSKKNCRIVIGKMGWRKKGSKEIFWEYG